MNKLITSVAASGIVGIISGCVTQLPPTKQEVYNNCIKKHIEQFAKKKYDAELILCDSNGNHYHFERIPEMYCKDKNPDKIYTKK